LLLPALRYVLLNWRLRRLPLLLRGLDSSCPVGCEGGDVFVKAKKANE
jgi:hypothetical protein